MSFPVRSYCIYYLLPHKKPIANVPEQPKTIFFAFQNYSIQTPYDCIDYPEHIIDPHSKHGKDIVSATEAPDGNTKPSADAALEEWGQSLNIGIQVVGMIVGLSSRQHILLVRWNF